MTESAHNNAREFLKSQGDAVEKVLADAVCPLIPDYAVFWARFIGAVARDGHIEPRPITGLEEMGTKDRLDVEQVLDAIRSSHYTLFAHVYSGQKKLQYITSQDGQPFEGQRHADYVEAVEEFYFHFGIILTQLERMLAVFSGIRLDAENLRGQVRPILEQSLQSDQVAAVIRYVYDDALKNVRHSVEHYARSPITFEEKSKRYMVLLPRKKGESWPAYQSRLQPDSGDMVLVSELVRKDFENLLALVNASYPKVMS